MKYITVLLRSNDSIKLTTFFGFLYLSQRVPPLRIDDLINDLRDGTKLIALLEVLSGERLPVEKGRVLRRPHFLSNANTALQFLASKRIKLVNINPADLVDGRPPVVLGLIWTIILYFQVSWYLKKTLLTSHSSLWSTVSLTNWHYHTRTNPNWTLAEHNFGTLSLDQQPLTIYQL